MVGILTFFIAIPNMDIHIVCTHLIVNKTEKQIMRKKTFSILLWSLVIVVVASLSFYIFWEMGQKQEKEVLKDETPQVETSITTEEQKEPAVKQEDPPFVSSEVTSPPKPVPVENPCIQIEKDINSFFRYLDKKDYVRNLAPETDMYTRFTKIIKKLTDNPPIPAEKTSDNEHMIRNITHFFHILGKDDLQLIKEMINNEQGTMELDIKMFFKWLSLKNRCHCFEELKPSMESIYQYAGFFLNTIGGRAYLFRRTSTLRLLVSYYCLLILHEADRTGENRYGLDIYPHIALVKNEITNYPAFQFQQEYIEQLSRLESYYLEKRNIIP